MAVSTDTIQTLLRQRQDLREALLNLRKEIETLDASSLDLVNKNIKTASPASVTATTAAPVPAPSSKPVAAEIPPEEKPAPTPTPEPEPQTAAAAAVAPAPAREKDEVTAEESPRKEPVLTTPAAPPPEKSVPEPETAEATQDAVPETAEPAAAEKETSKADDAKTGQQENSPTDPPEEADEGAHDDLEELLEKARALSDYLLDHPSNLPAAELGALVTAITVSDAAKTPAEKKACYHTLQAAYRKISAGTFAASGVNGTTLQDSEAGAPLLWTIPFAISILIIILFPLLLLTRHLVGEMFTDDFAADLTWSIGLAAAFLWGTVGALTLLTLNIARAVYRRRFDGGLQRSPGLRGALGGLTGGVVFMIVEIWLPMSDATADFALDAIAFAGGMFSAILFAGLQRLVNAVTGWLEPVPKPAKPAKSPKK